MAKNREKSEYDKFKDEEVPTLLLDPMKDAKEGRLPVAIGKLIPGVTVPPVEMKRTEILPNPTPTATEEAIAKKIEGWSKESANLASVATMGVTAREPDYKEGVHPLLKDCHQLLRKLQAGRAINIYCGSAHADVDDMIRRLGKEICVSSEEKKNAAKSS